MKSTLDCNDDSWGSYSAQLQDGFPRVHQNVTLRLSMT
jgi:hypothetical protein